MIQQGGSSVSVVGFGLNDSLRTVVVKQLYIFTVSILRRTTLRQGMSKSSER